MENKENTLNVRRLVGGIFLAIGAVSGFFTASSYSGAAMFGVVREFQQFMYFFAAWALGLAIWYLVTLKKAPNRKAEKIVKIIFFIVVGINVIFAFMNDMSNAGGFGIGLMIVYSIGCPWGKQGYAKHPYPDDNTSKKTA
jgi:predicted membrane channel-forming protein YqfA (hemolysin III family)